MKTNNGLHKQRIFNLMRKKSQNTVQKNFPISPELDKKLKKHSQKTELSEAYLIREAIKKYLCENIPTSITK